MGKKCGEVIQVLDGIGETNLKEFSAVEDWEPSWTKRVTLAEGGFEGCS